MKKLLIIALLIVGCESVYIPNDCKGYAGGDAVEDVCGVCEGDGVCLPEHCTDDNKSGYCQDLNVLQILIDNSLGTLNMDMDENSNGVIEPLELGVQEWLDGRLVYLQCVNIGLLGKIPSEIGNLTSLTWLSLSYNELTGKIPSEIGNLTSLAVLMLYYNELTGEIPSEIGNLTSLTSLGLSNNELTGEISSGIGNLTSLTFLNLSNNELIGEIPDEIGNLTNLEHLYLDINQLTGEIPQEVCDLIESNNLSIDKILDGNNLTNTCE